ncbi:hypothetical protein [Siccirubricoccus sp. G192]|nr:hypothetical protein [Siccirubricoccus sp. G192]MBV1800078.1 hypothetical protein [Siccirubricoccus sp. G192]
MLTDIIKEGTVPTPIAGHALPFAVIAALDMADSLLLPGVWQDAVRQ